MSRSGEVGLEPPEPAFRRERPSNTGAVAGKPDGAFALGDIEAIEVYNHPSILPDQFNSGRDSLCGVVVVWRKQSTKQ